MWAQLSYYISSFDKKLRKGAFPASEKVSRRSLPPHTLSIFDPPHP